MSDLPEKPKQSAHSPRTGEKPAPTPVPATTTTTTTQGSGSTTASTSLGSASGPATGTTLSGSTTTTPPPIVPGRWRFAVGTIQVTGSVLAADTAPTTTRPLIEMYAATIPATGKIPLTVVPPGFADTPVTIRVTRAEYQRLLALATPVLPLLDKHNGTAGYAPFGAPLYLSGSPGPMDVRQGEIGSCRTASALQALAASPNGPAYIRSLITVVDGGFQVTLRDAPRPGSEGRAPTRDPIFVEPLFPVDGATGLARYCLYNRPYGGTDFALWPAVLEKALAILWGGYEWLEHPRIHEDRVFNALGLYAERLDCAKGGKLDLLNSPSGPATAAMIERFLLEAKAKSCAVTCPGMNYNHNYAVIEIQKDGAFISDPRTGFATADLARWAEKSRPKLLRDELLVDPAVWPISFDWANLVKRFRWLCAYAVPKIEKGDGKEKE